MILTRYLIRFLFITGLIITVLRLENFLYENKSSNYQPVQANNELVLSELSEPDQIYRAFNDNQDYESVAVEKANSTFSYKVKIRLYNNHINIKFKSIQFNYFYNADVVTIIQKSNIWHKSSTEEPAIYC